MNPKQADKAVVHSFSLLRKLHVATTVLVLGLVLELVLAGGLQVQAATAHQVAELHVDESSPAPAISSTLDAGDALVSR